MQLEVVTMNNGNLKPYKKGELTSEEAKRRGANGGKASVKARSYQSIFQKMLNAPLNDDQKAKLEQFGIDPEEATYMTMMFASVMSTTTKKGDFKALEKTMELAGLSKKLELEQRMKENELHLKERDLELREKQFEYQQLKDKGEVKEEDKVIIINDLEYDKAE